MDQELVTLLNSTSQELETILNSKTVVGAPIALGETTIIPLISVGFGLGVGGGSGSDAKKGRGSGNGMGCGGGVRPVAVLIADQNGVRVEAIKGGAASAAENIAETLGKALGKEKKTEPTE